MSYHVYLPNVNVVFALEISLKREINSLNMTAVLDCLDYSRHFHFHINYRINYRIKLSYDL